MSDEVRVDDDVVSKHLHEAMAAVHDGKTQADPAAALAAHNDAKWAGNDEAGHGYRAATAQLNELLRPGGTVEQSINALGDLFSKVKTAKDNSLASDAEQAKELRKAQQDL